VIDPASLTDLQLDGWNLKVREPQDAEAAHPVVLLIHGWTGDERSMWVFAQRLPKQALLIAPRAPYASKHENLAGYSWVEERAGQFSELPAFEPALGSFEGLLAKLAEKYSSADFAKFGLVGFSQGAAFSFAFALSQPERVSKLAALAGFLPAGGESELARLAGKPIFIAHGTQDETVPVSKAREAHAALQAAGASVRYCESDTGHKLDANCARELEEFFTSKA
jgi:phospholipase/carboxylesterase